MQYKTIVLELLLRQPRLHEELRRKRKLLTVLNSLAGELKHLHEALKQNLSTAKPELDQSQIASAALEIALTELEHRFRLAFPRNGQRPLTLDASMAFLRNLT